jgi:hypothetical protein
MIVCTVKSDFQSKVSSSSERSRDDAMYRTFSKIQTADQFIRTVDQRECRRRHMASSEATLRSSESELKDFRTS